MSFSPQSSSAVIERTDSMQADDWHACEGQWFAALQIPHCDMIYVQRKGHGSYAVVASIGSRDISIRGGFTCEADAEEYARKLTGVKAGS